MSMQVSLRGRQPEATPGDRIALVAMMLFEFIRDRDTVQELFPGTFLIRLLERHWLE